jgi:hypothetical protein
MEMAAGARLQEFQCEVPRDQLDLTRLEPRWTAIEPIIARLVSEFG